MVTQGSWDPITARVPGRGHLRASDADRERVVDTLKAAFVQGRLTKEELGMRTGLALMSRTYGELTAITADIPAGRSDPRLRPRTTQAYSRRRDRKTVAWAAFMILMPATLGAAFLTYYAGFLVLFMVAFIGVTITAQP